MRYFFTVGIKLLGIKLLGIKLLGIDPHTLKTME